MPFCLLRQPDGSYVVANRRYKPVGITRTDQVDYAEYPVQVKFKRMSKVTARRLSWNGSDDLERIALYDDTCIPTDGQAHWDAYSARLQRLADLQVTPG